VKCDAKRVANNLKDVAIMYIHSGLQDCMVALAQTLPLVGILLRQFGAALDIGK
jgi:hypothetical protein